MTRTRTTGAVAAVAVTLLTLTACGGVQEITPVSATVSTDDDPPVGICPEDPAPCGVTNPQGGIGEGVTNPRRDTTGVKAVHVKPRKVHRLKSKPPVYRYGTGRVDPAPRGK